MVICLAKISCNVDDKVKEWLFYAALDAQQKWLKDGKVGKKPTESSIVNEVLTRVALGVDEK